MIDPHLEHPGDVGERIIDRFVNESCRGQEPADAFWHNISILRLIRFNSRQNRDRRRTGFDDRSVVKRARHVNLDVSGTARQGDHIGDPI
jgi:hypothetical protein